MSWLPLTVRRSNAVAIACIIGALVAVALALTVSAGSAPGAVALTVIPWDSSVVANIQIYPGRLPGASGQDGSIAGAKLVAEQIVPAGSAYHGIFRLQPGDYTVSASPSAKGQQEHAHSVAAHVNLVKDTQIILRDCTQAGIEAIAATPAVPYSAAVMGAGRGRNVLQPPCPH